MARLKGRCPDRALLRLINRYLNAGVRVGETLEPTRMGVPQGGPLSPVLATWYWMSWTGNSTGAATFCSLC